MNVQTESTALDNRIVEAENQLAAAKINLKAARELIDANSITRYVRQAGELSAELHRLYRQRRLARLSTSPKGG